MKLQEEIFKTYSLRLVQTAEELERQGNFIRDLLPDSNIFGIDMSPNDIRYAQDTCPPQWTDLFNFRALIFLSLLRRQENMM